MSLDLEAYRKSKRLTYRALGAIIGMHHPGRMREWSLGLCWPDADRLQQILDATHGEVSLEAMHRRRLTYLSQTKGYRHQRQLHLAAE